MDDLKKSILESLDGSRQEDLFPFLPYLLQDLWDMGADPATMLALIKDNIQIKKPRILDLGCGKGAVAITIARKMDCSVRGIDAMPDFIESAWTFAKKYGVQDKCDFEIGDMREKMKELRGFDIVIFGATGPVLGDWETTLKAAAGLLNRPGYVLFDDGYIGDDSKSAYQRCPRKTEFYRQLNSSGFEIVSEVVLEKGGSRETNLLMYQLIEKRANELMRQHPDKKEIFEGYLKSQQYENYVLENEITAGTWLLKII